MKNSRTQNDFLYTKFIIRPAILFSYFYNFGIVMLDAEENIGESDRQKV